MLVLALGCGNSGENPIGSSGTNSGGSAHAGASGQPSGGSSATSGGANPTGGGSATGGAPTTGGSSSTGGGASGAGAAGVAGSQAGSGGGTIAVRPRRRVSTYPRWGCAIRTSGDLACWGIPAGGFEVPAEVPGPFSQVEVGDNLGCAVRMDSSLWCIGDASLESNPAPNDSFTSLETWGSACGVTTSGAIRCWGEGSFGVIDGAPTGAYEQVSVGWRFACAIRASDRGLDCWGETAEVELDDEAYLQVSVGYVHWCGIRDDGTLRCGKTADMGGQGAQSLMENFGQADPPAGRFVQVSVGTSHTCALRDDGSATCFGAGRRQGDLAACEASLEDCGMSVVPEGTFEEIAAGVRTTCGIRTSGELVCWGTSTGPPPPTDFR